MNNINNINYNSCQNIDIPNNKYNNKQIIFIDF